MSRSKKINSPILVSALIAHSLFFNLISQAKPEALSFVLVPKKVKVVSKKGQKPTLPFASGKLLTDYQVFWRAQKTFESKKLPSASEIEAIERAVLLVKMSAPTRTLEKELDELFAGLELKRGEAFAHVKNDGQAYLSFQRGLTLLPTLKWPYYWRESSSIALAQVCSRNPKVKNESCLSLAKKVSDAFPKPALETKILRDLPQLDPTPPVSEVTGDRLSQNYPADRTDKDEKAFEDVLAAYTAENETDLSKKIDDFAKEYPKSILRFRAQFLLAETFTKKGKTKEAEKIYQSLTDQTPLGFYALVSSERMKVSAQDKIKKDPILVDQELFNFNAQEKITLARIDALAKEKKFDEMGLEFDSLTRSRNYSLDTILYLMGYAHHYQQNLSAFRLISELIQRQYSGLMNSEMIEMIFPYAYEKEIAEAARTYKVDPLLVTSLIKQESGYRSTAISGSGALGLMQLMPFTALDTQSDVRLVTLKDPAPNILVGTKYLASLLEKYEGNAVYALAAYNAGPHRVAKWKKDLKPGFTMIDFIEAIPFKETRDYVMSILRNRYWYQVRKGIPPTSLFDTWK